MVRTIKTKQVLALALLLSTFSGAVVAADAQRQETVQTVQAQLDDLQRRYDRAKEDFAHLAEEQSAQEEAISAENNGLKEQNRQLTKDLQLSKAAVAALSADLESIKSEMKTLESFLAKKTVELKISDGRVSDLERTITSVETLSEERANALETQKQLSRSLEARLKDFEKMIEEQTQEIAELRQQINELSKENEQLIDETVDTFPFGYNTGSVEGTFLVEKEASLADELGLVVPAKQFVETATQTNRAVRAKLTVKPTEAHHIAVTSIDSKEVQTTSETADAQTETNHVDFADAAVQANSETTGAETQTTSAVFTSAAVQTDSVQAPVKESKEVQVTPAVADAQVETNSVDFADAVVQANSDMADAATETISVAFTSVEVQTAEQQKEAAEQATQTAAVEMIAKDVQATAQTTEAQVQTDADKKQSQVLQNLIDEKNEFANKIKQIGDELAQVKTTLGIEKVKAKHALEDKDALDKKLQELQATVNPLKEQEARLRQEIARLEQCLRQAETQEGLERLNAKEQADLYGQENMTKLRLQDQLAELQKQNFALLEKIAQLEKAIREVEQQKNNCETEIRSLSSNVQMGQKHLDELSKQLQTCRNELSDSQVRLSHNADSRKQADALQTQVAQLQAEVTKLNEDIKREKTTNQVRFDEAHRVMQQQAAQKEVAFKERETVLAKQVQEAQAALIAVRQANAQSEAELSVAKTDLQQVRLDKVKLQQRADSLQEIIMGYLNGVPHLIDIISEYFSKKEKYTFELTDLSKQRGDLQQKVIELDAAFAAAKAKEDANAARARTAGKVAEGALHTVAQGDTTAGAALAATGTALYGLGLWAFGGQSESEKINTQRSALGKQIGHLDDRIALLEKRIAGEVDAITVTLKGNLPEPK